MTVTGPRECVTIRVRTTVSDCSKQIAREQMPVTVSREREQYLVTDLTITQPESDHDSVLECTNYIRNTLVTLHE